MWTSVELDQIGHECFPHWQEVIFLEDRRISMFLNFFFELEFDSFCFGRSWRFFVAIENLGFNVSKQQHEVQTAVREVIAERLYVSSGRFNASAFEELVDLGLRIGGSDLGRFFD